tara:strand:+ start:560 stop:994 length:435 start_codon:yes stop_codon:yes gene_type:complete
VGAQEEYKTKSALACLVTSRSEWVIIAKLGAKIRKRTKKIGLKIKENLVKVPNKLYLSNALVDHKAQLRTTLAIILKSQRFIINLLSIQVSFWEDLKHRSINLWFLSTAILSKINKTQLFKASRQELMLLLALSKEAIMIKAQR